MRNDEIVILNLIPTPQSSQTIRSKKKEKIRKEKEVRYPPFSTFVSIPNYFTPSHLN